VAVVYIDGMNLGAASPTEERPANAAEVLLRRGEQDELERRRPGPTKLPCIGCGKAPSPCWYAEPPSDYPICDACYHLPEAEIEAVVARWEREAIARARIAHTRPPPGAELAARVSRLPAEVRADVERYIALREAGPLDREALGREVRARIVREMGDMAWTAEGWEGASTADEDIAEHLFRLGQASSDSRLREAAREVERLWSASAVRTIFPRGLLEAIERLLAVLAEGPEPLPGVDKPGAIPASLADLAALFRAWERAHEECARNPELDAEARSYQEGKSHGIMHAADVVERAAPARRLTRRPARRPR
jgi:hypothetical protein